MPSSSLADGYMEVYSVLKEDDFSKGVFTGYVIDKNSVKKDVIFDVSFDNYSEESYASSMTIGTVKEEMGNAPLVLSFGEVDPILNDTFYEEYILNEQVLIEEPSIMSNMSLLGEPDYTLRAYDDFNSSYGDIMYVAAYHPAVIGDHENASMYIKSWTNKDNIEDYMANYFNTYIVNNSAAVYKYILDIENEDYWDADDPTPVDGDNSFNMILPVYIGGSFQLISVPITTNYTDYTSTGSPNDNKSTWTFEKYIGSFNSTDAQSTTPWYTNDSYGVGSSIKYSYQYTLSSNVEKDIKFSSKFYISAVADEGMYVTKYLAFLHDVDSSITVTP